MFQRQHHAWQKIPGISALGIDEASEASPDNIEEIIDRATRHPILDCIPNTIGDLLVKGGGKAGDAGMQLGAGVPCHDMFAKLRHHQ